MMDFSLTKEELEEKLRALDATRDSFEPVGIFAMCYSPVRMMPDAVVSKTCEGCGKRFDVAVRSYGAQNVLSDYRQVAKGFRDLGYDAQILYYCDECVNERSLPSLTSGRFPALKVSQQTCSLALRRKGKRSIA